MSVEEPKIVRTIKKKVPWLSHLVKDPAVAFDLNIPDQVEIVTPRGSLCVLCKGARMLCRKSRCPLLTRIQSYLKVKPLIDQENLEGASPPGVFVGRLGYPYVFAGPLVPPVSGDTSMMDQPEGWFGKTMDEIVDFRLRLVRGKRRVDVRRPEMGGRMMDDVKELALSDSSVDVELTFKGRPRRSFILNDEVQPIGPSALMERMEVGNVKVDRRLEKAHYDTDLLASDAIVSLYDSGVLVSRIQKALSVGAFGLKKRRRLVPTRWSITAVDSMISQSLMDEVKTFPLMNEFRVYESNYLDNRFEILMMPEGWKYEGIEAWYPGTIWNPSLDEIFMFGDWEGFKGRTTYARMGGCYYAARLAVNEKLMEERRQATVIVLRESHPNYIMPVGVWQVRENVRNALRHDPLKFNSLDEVLKHVSGKFGISLRVWIRNSTLLSNALRQRKITEFV